MGNNIMNRLHGERYITVNPMTSAVTLSPRMAHGMNIRRADTGVAAVAFAYDKGVDRYIIMRISTYAQQRMFSNVVSYNPVTKQFGFILGGLHDQLTVAGLLDHYGIEDMQPRRIDVEWEYNKTARRKFFYLRLSRENPKAGNDGKTE